MQLLNSSGGWGNLLWSTRSLIGDFTIATLLLKVVYNFCGCPSKPSAGDRSRPDEDLTPSEHRAEGGSGPSSTEGSSFQHGYSTRPGCFSRRAVQDHRA